MEQTIDIIIINLSSISPAHSSFLFLGKNTVLASVLLFHDHDITTADRKECDDPELLCHSTKLFIISSNRNWMRTDI